MKTLTVIGLCLLTCASCFNKTEVKEEPIPFCGVINMYSTNIPAPGVFKANCATCHNFHKDGTGPKMNGVLERSPSEEWLITFITNQDSLIEIEDKYTLEVMERKPTKWAHDYNDLEKKDLDTLMSYITQ
ncbi:MAG: cytochrome c [Crocinitomicaceae bacterium]|nr:cytochrome c [Crocinitomicaceae bacterium]